jgi:3-oxoacyl-[acyl-carrier protein] reductase
MSEQLSTALVTGGSRGIGKAIAETLAKAGYQVYLTYVSKADEAEAVARNIVAAGGKACAFRLDVADAEAVAAFFKERIKDQVELDVLVNNAGITKDGLMLRMKDEDFDRVIQTNLRGAFVCDPPASRADHQYQLRGRTDGQCRADQLRFRQGGPHRPDQVRGQGAGRS